MSRRHGEQDDFQSIGPIATGLGRPRDLAGHPGNVYVDTATQNVYLKSNKHGRYSWGAYLFTMAAFNGIMPGQIRWYSVGGLPSELGRDGDYAIVWDPASFQIVPYVWGPRINGAWGNTGEGAPLRFSIPSVLTLLGLGAELDNQSIVINAAPVTFIGLGGSEAAGFPIFPTQVTPIGLPSLGMLPPNWTVNASVDTGPADTSN